MTEAHPTLCTCETCKKQFEELFEKYLGKPIEPEYPLPAGFRWRDERIRSIRLRLLRSRSDKTSSTYADFLQDFYRYAPGDIEWLLSENEKLAVACTEYKKEAQLNKDVRDDLLATKAEFQVAIVEFLDAENNRCSHICQNTSHDHAEQRKLLNQALSRLNDLVAGLRD